MPVFDAADNLINPDHYTEKLVGAMCEVTFTLKHYAIAAQTKANGNVVDANDVFSAHVENISILKKPPTLPRSPYKNRTTKKPHHRPQLPTRSEQVNAAAAFVPRFHSNSNSPRTSKSPAPSAFESPDSTDPSNTSVIDIDGTATMTPSTLTASSSAYSSTPTDTSLNRSGTINADKASTSSSVTSNLKVKPQGTAYTINPPNNPKKKLT